MPSSHKYAFNFIIKISFKPKAEAIAYKRLFKQSSPQAFFP